MAHKALLTQKDTGSARGKKGPHRAGIPVLFGALRKESEPLGGGGRGLVVTLSPLRGLTVHERTRLQGGAGEGSSRGRRLGLSSK